MKVVITDKYNKQKEFSFENEKLAVLPQIGDKIAWFYNPAPKVIERVWWYEEDTVYIIVE